MERIDFIVPGTGEQLSGVILDRYDDADGIPQTLIQSDDGRIFQLTDEQLAAE